MAPRRGFRHEALIYAGVEDFVARTAPFIRAGLEADEPVLVVVDATKISRLRNELGDDASDVRFADMRAVGGNPARIIPVWVDFVNEPSARSRSRRGIGEPIWAGRTPAELVESQRHEALLNLAFVDDPDLWLLCPYDSEALAPDVIDEAHRSHPLIVDDGIEIQSDTFQGIAEISAPFDAPLPDPPPTALALFFSADGLSRLRDVASSYARDIGMDAARAAEVSLAVSEIATNTIRHAGGRGQFRIWANGDSLAAEVSDAGRIGDPLIGRRRPEVDQRDGRGMWIVNQLCDLVQVRTYATGNVVRLQFRLP